MSDTKNEKIQKKTKVARRRPLFIVGMALFLAFLLAAYTLLSGMVRITMPEGVVEDALLADSSDYLKENTEYLTKSEFARIFDYLRTTLRRPTTIEDYYTLASRSIADVNYERAIQYIDKCIELGGQYTIDLWLKKGALHRELGHYEPALESFKKAIDLDQRSVEAILMAAQTCIDIARYEESLSYLYRYLVLDPGNEQIINAAAELNHFIGDYEKAADYYTRAIDLAEDKTKVVELYLSRAKCYVMFESYDTMIEDMTFYIENGGAEPAAAYYLRAAAHVKVGDLENAITDYQGALDNGVEEVAICNEQIVRCLFELQRIDEVIERGLEYIEAAENDEQFYEIYQYIGLSYLLKSMESGDAEDYRNADKYLTESLNRSDSDISNYLYRGSARMSIENYEGAIEDFNVCIEAGVMEKNSYYNRALCYLNLDAESVDYFLAAFADLEKARDLPGDEEITAQATALIETLSPFVEEVLELQGDAPSGDASAAD